VFCGLVGDEELRSVRIGTSIRHTHYNDDKRSKKGVSYGRGDEMRDDRDKQTYQYLDQNA